MKDIVASGKNKASDTKKFLENSNPIVLLYELQGCPHCTAIEEPWANAISHLKANKDVAEHIDCANAIYFYDKGAKAKGKKTRFDYLPEQLKGVSGFPAIHIIHHGTVVDEYNGDRTEESIIEFVKDYVHNNKPKSAPVPKKSSKEVKPTKAKKPKAKTV